MRVIARPLLTSLFIAAVACVSQSAFAQKTGKPSRSDMPLIVETRIVAPKRVGEFAFEFSRYEAEHKLSGAQFRYSHPQYPTIRFDLFVYPAGKTSNGAAMKTGMKGFRDSLIAAAEGGYFRDFKIVATDPFEVLPPLPTGSNATSAQTAPHAASDNSDASTSEIAGGASNGNTSSVAHPAPTVEAAVRAGTAATTATDDKLSEAQVKTLVGMAPIRGERMKLSYRIEDKDSGGEIAMRSRGYLFYKQLYFFKGRISATEAEIDEAAFSDIADRAMRGLVASVQAHNIGGCGQTTIAIDPDAPKDQMMETMMKAMTESLTRTAEDNCATTFDADEYARLKDTAEIVAIEYDAADWKSP
jgi:hypothetical protein